MDEVLLQEIRYVRARVDEIYNVATQNETRVCKLEERMNNHITEHWKFFGALIAIIVTTIAAILVGLWNRTGGN